MRKILSLLLVLLALMSLLPTAVLAATEHINTLPYATSFAIKARVVYTSGLPEFPIDQGKGGGTLPDGTEIWVENAPNGAVTLVVRKIDQSETGPYTWFKQVLNGKGELFQAYEIYFLDVGRNRIAATNVRVALSVPGNMRKAMLYSVDSSGAFSQLTDTLHGVMAVFTTDGRPYYVFAGYKPFGVYIPGSGFIKTGDASHIFLWSGICAASLLILLLIFWLLKKRKKEEHK